jgi:hypothetical protein
MQGVFNFTDVGPGPSGPSGPTGPTGPGADQALNTTSTVSFSGLTVNGPALFNSSTVFTDNILELHASTSGSWTFSDGKDIGIRMHYYINTGTSAALVLANDSRALEWYSTGTEVGGIFTGSYGTFKTGAIQLVNTTTTLKFSDNSVQTTAWLGTGTLMTQAVTATYAQSFNTATVVTSSINSQNAQNVTGGSVLGSVATGTTSTTQVGYLVVPQIATNLNYTLTLNDQGKHIYSTTATGIQTITIPSYSSVKFPLGAAVTLILRGAGNISINTSSGVTLCLAGTNQIGDRILSSNGMATLLKVETDIWFVNGAGLV